MDFTTPTFRKEPLFQTQLGSPPPMRGKVFPSFSSYQTVGITPAYAGKSLKVLRIRRQTRDHPRLCGEKYVLIGCSGCVLGSPPPMRGKVRVISCKCCGNRITPAYAGKRSKESLSCSGSRDHPRLCGEKILFMMFSSMFLGSPPPMRGKVRS